jgi:predicted metal-dependent HD superfamily phosphohydrolase
VAGVRAEYAHVADADFRRGRAAVLRDLLAKPTLFHTAAARALWEERARANVAGELASLECPPGPQDRLTGQERSVRPD